LGNPGAHAEIIVRSLALEHELFDE
jgi:hypothetical protein